jgi:hypothetical protein
MLACHSDAVLAISCCLLSGPQGVAHLPSVFPIFSVVLLTFSLFHMFYVCSEPGVKMEETRPACQSDMKSQ